MMAAVKEFYSEYIRNIFGIYSEYMLAFWLNTQPEVAEQHAFGKMCLRPFPVERERACRRQGTMVCRRRRGAASVKAWWLAMV